MIQRMFDLDDEELLKCIYSYFLVRLGIYLAVLLIGI